MKWAILTGEYPHQPGGISDYTRLVAFGLAAAGDEVHVWGPAAPESLPADPGVCARRLPDHFGGRGLAALDRELDALRPDRVLVQYVPHAYGFRAMNVGFCQWVARRGRRDAVWSMFHEVAFPLRWRQPVRHNLLAATHRLMAGLVARASRRVFVSIPAWGELLGPLAGGSRPFEWLPVPTNLPTQIPPAAVAAARERTLGPGRLLVGHFGTFGGPVAHLLAGILPPLLADHDRTGLLVGHGGPTFAAALSARHPHLAGRLVATGGLPAGDAAAHLAACDLLVQPYPDGVSTRRGSVMGGLALGAAIVTNTGPLSEGIWATTGAVALAAEPTSGAIVAEAERALADPRRRGELGERARNLYASRFDIRHTIAALRGGSPW